MAFLWNIERPAHERDEHYMRMAIEEAKKCTDEKRFGAAVVDFGTNRGGVTIAKAFSAIEAESDITQHAELRAISQSARALHNDRDRFRSCTLYSTCEPCIMCAGAIFWARIGRVVYGIRKTQSLHNFYHSSLLPNFPTHPHPHLCPSVVGGVLAAESLALLPPPADEDDRRLSVREYFSFRRDA